MGIFQNNLLAGAAAAASAGGGGFYSHQIAQSARFDRASQSYLTQDFGTLTAAKWTVSLWFKRAQTGYAFSTLIGRTDGNAQLYFSDADALINDSKYTNTVDGLYRDAGGWTNLVYNQKSVNTAAAYVNGVERSVTVSGSGSFFIPWHTTSTIGNMSGTGDTRFFDGYMAEVVGVYNQDLDNTDFGEFKNGVWIPIEPNVTFGSNDYYLKFENASDLGNDSSGNNNDFTANNMGTDHQVLDSPTFGS
jgi:hypothetical protein|tara:strand:+ start:142 stop:882 length:741 start_codon:yes stop_codon:yes gene_type:complete